MFDILIHDTLRIAETEDIFQAPSPEEVEQRKAEWAKISVQRVLDKCTKNADGTYSCKGDVDLGGLGLTKLPVKFKRVGGSFYCDSNRLTSLEGAPEYVGGWFDCYCNRLVSLEGAPERVEGDFSCSHNKLTTLEGAPKYVGGNFYCNNNSVEFTSADVRKVCKAKDIQL